MRPDTASLDLVRRYGAFDGSLEYEIHDPRSLAIGPEGDVYVFDLDAGIKHFDASGEFRGWVARIGAGPGEVGLATRLAAGPLGEVAAYDPRNGRIAVFLRDSAMISLRLPAGMERYAEDGLFFGEDGSLWVGINPLLGVEPVTFPRPAFARFDAGGALVDTVFVSADVAVECPMLSAGLYRAGFWEDKRVQWIPKATWAMGPDGSLAIGCPARYQLDVLRPEAPVLRVGRTWTPVLTDPDEAAFYEQVWQPIPPLPRQRPAYARILLPLDGRIWVWPVQPSRRRQLDEDARAMSGRAFGWEAGQHGAFDVFAPSGEWIGSVALPEGVAYSGYPGSPPVVIRADTLWSVMRDSLQVPYIGRFQVRWP